MLKMPLVVAIGLSLAGPALADATFIRMQHEGEYGEMVMDAYMTACKRGMPSYEASSTALSTFHNLLTEIKRNSPAASETAQRTVEGAMSALSSECAKMR